MRDEIIDFLVGILAFSGIAVVFAVFAVVFFWGMGIFLNSQPFEDCNIQAKSQGVNDYMVKGTINKTCIYYKDGKRIEVRV